MNEIRILDRLIRSISLSYEKTNCFVD